MSQVQRRDSLKQTNQQPQACISNAILKTKVEQTCNPRAPPLPHCATYVQSMLLISCVNTILLVCTVIMWQIPQFNCTYIAPIISRILLSTDRCIVVIHVMEGGGGRFMACQASVPMCWLAVVSFGGTEQCGHWCSSNITCKNPIVFSPRWNAFLGIAIFNRHCKNDMHKYPQLQTKQILET